MKYKFTPKRDYPILGFLLVLILFALVLFSNKQDTGELSGTKNALLSDEVHKNLPQDEIHRGVAGAEGTPSSANVSPRFIQMLDSMRKDVADHPADTLKIHQLADILGQAHQNDEATVYYEKILRKYPKRTDLIFSMAYLNFVNQKFDKVNEYMHRVLKIQPDNSDAKFNLGTIAFREGKNDEAREWWQEIIRKNPGSEIASRARASIAQLKK